MFERFTDRARRAIVLAQEEAVSLRHNYIGTEHLLLGLLHEGESVAARALESLGVSLPMARSRIEEIIGLGQEPVRGQIPFTPRAKKVLELSLREALQMGHNYIGPEHILLGLIREGHGGGAQVLTKLGATQEKVRGQVLKELGDLGVSVPEIPEGVEPRAGGPPAPLSARAQAAMVLAEEIAQKLDHMSVEPEDLLRALLALAIGDPEMRDKLRELGVDLDDAKLNALSWSRSEGEEPTDDPESAGETET
jgi:ATP-dependent Clp protease ATP-binding subunit ClpA